MEAISSVELFRNTVFLAVCGSLLIPYFEYIKNKTVPDIEFIPENKKEHKLKPTIRSIRARQYFIFCLGVMGIFSGICLALYWLSIDRVPNEYGQILWPLIVGFISPQIFSWLQLKAFPK